jgi:hypothetical protein
VDPAEQFYPSDHDCRRREPFETEHRTEAKFHTTVVLLYQVIKILRRPHLRIRWQLAVGVDAGQNPSFFADVSSDGRPGVRRSRLSR